MLAWLDQESPAAVPAADARGRRRGFTLVELLVVVAIITLLVAIMAPTLARARALTQLVLCQGRLHQWGQAFAIYALENDHTFPHIDGLDRSKGPADLLGWVDVVPPVMDERPWRDHPLFARPGTDTIFQCPAARVLPDGHYRYRPSREGYFSYAMNSCLELDENCWRAPGDGGRPMPSFLKTDLIVRPEQVVLLFDQLLDPRFGYDMNKPYPKAGKYCGSYPKAFSARHAGQPGGLGGSILYCDGHVEWAEGVWKDSWPPDLEVPPRHDADWFPYPSGE